ncbi:TPA: hypothetical protein QH074_004296 [Enterobacter hormaechei subsp. steigerwaltii]|nr:hypothetical protein [Enterobacter hormaechei subsp. steigerwaltii]
MKLKALAAVAALLVTVNAAAAISVTIPPNENQRPTDTTAQIRAVLDDLKHARPLTDAQDDTPLPVVQAYQKYRDRIELMANAFVKPEEQQQYSGTVCKVMFSAQGTRTEDGKDETLVAALDGTADNDKPGCKMLETILQAHALVLLDYPQPIYDYGDKALFMIMVIE